MIENKVKENCTLCHNKPMCWVDGNAGFKDTCKSRWQAELKTLDGWRGYDGDFGKYVERGDKIDAALYDYFLNILPPFDLSHNRMIAAGFQCSEAIRTGIDYNGDQRELYSTFGVIDGEYYYLGLNFRGEVKSMYRFGIDF